LKDVLREANVQLAALGKIKPAPFIGLLYRGIKMNTLFSKDPPEPLYASAAQNRYNFKGTETLYFGENFLTAYAETVQKYAGLLIAHPTREQQVSGGFDLISDEPIVLFGLKASLSQVLDLTDSTVRSALDITEHSLTHPWRWAAAIGEIPLTQQLGDAVYRSQRFEAIRYPSEKAGDTGARIFAALAVFVDRLHGRSFLEVSDVSKRLTGRLPINSS
jgi:hypothetical protein